LKKAEAKAKKERQDKKGKTRKGKTRKGKAKKHDKEKHDKKKQAEEHQYLHTHPNQDQIDWTKTAKEQATGRANQRR
jgi:hypothetical protein